jgi:hypothetical protein
VIHRELATLAVEEAPAAPRWDHAAAAGAGTPRGGWRRPVVNRLGPI